jgi:hypothetical protein
MISDLTLADLTCRVNFHQSRLDITEFADEKLIKLTSSESTASQSIPGDEGPESCRARRSHVLAGPLAQ